MDHWNAGTLLNLLALTVLLALAAGLRNRMGPLRRLGIPDSIVAGALGLALGPSVLGWIPFDVPSLETLVYHGFALVFIAVSLQRPASSTRSGGARSVAIAIPTLAVLQVLVGLVVVGAWASFDSLHPGFALLPMLGFSQGPGQALSLGAAWEPLGLADGGQLGLSFAALGFATCCLVGIPTIAWARRAGWVHREPRPEPAPQHTEADASTTAGLMEPLTSSVVAIGVVYVAVFAVISGIVYMLPEDSSLIPTAWGFHFIIGALLAMGVRRGAQATGQGHRFNDRLLGRLSVLFVDVTTTAALSAVTLAVLSRWLLPIVALCVVVTMVTLFASLWLARRAFDDEPFEHALLLFGMSTGTLPTGLALLRTLDPDLRGPVARSAALGVPGSIPLMAPLLVALLPFAVSLWESGPLVAIGVPLALVAVYLIVIAIAWRTLTKLRIRRPWHSLWPND